MTGVVADEVLADLQRSLLEGVLLDRPLPGADRAPAFGDRAFFFGRATIALLDENLAGGLPLDGLPLPVRVVAREELLEEARREGDVPYLRFPPPEKIADAVRLRLEATIATADPHRQVLGLSSLQATFRKRDGGWELEGEAIAAAN